MMIIFLQDQKKTRDVIYALTTYNEKDLAAGDLTGRFSYRSSRGNQYVMIMYNWDSNLIWGLPLKKRTALEIVSTWTQLNAQLTTSGFKPNLFIFDNEFSGEFRNTLQGENITLQLVTPHMHRNNPVERAIQTWKDHFLAVLASVHPDFPMAEWDRIIPQCNITLNLLRASQIHPQLSSYASVFGNFNFNRTPLAPPGTKIVFHNKATQRASWAFHGQEGWYIGPAMDHYRNITGYFPKERSEKFTDTVTFIPHEIPIPQISLDEYLLQAVDDIISILQTPESTLPPTFKLGDPTRNALLEIIATTLKSTVDPPATPSSPVSKSVLESRVVESSTLPVTEPRVGLPEITDNDI